MMIITSQNFSGCFETAILFFTTARASMVSFF